VANGGTATATPSIVAGTNITVTGTWPNQTIAASSGGTPSGSNTQVQYNNAGAFGGITGATTNGTALTLVAPVLGTPASATLTNATGLPLTTGVTGTLPIANGGTGTASTTFADLATNVTGILPIANGGTATATPSLVQGTGVTITGTWPNQTIAATGSGGTVTAVSVASANGFAGTSSGGTTPALTLSTSITGVLKGNGTAISAATAGTDYVTPTGTETLTNKTIAYGSNTLTDVVGVTATQTLTNKTLTSPVLTTPQLGTPSSGTLSSCTVDGTDAVGFRNIPQNSQSTSYTLVLADSGKHILHPAADTTARTYTIPANSSVAYPIGTAITFINMTSQVVTIAISADTMYLSAAGTTGSRSLAQYGSATAIKITSTNWLISGTGLT
jgi:hypothetical protein